VKKVVDLLERAEGAVMLMTGGDIDDGDRELCDEAIKYINDAMALLQSPRQETPEQYKKRTGKPWPDNWAVYMRLQNKKGEWSGWLPTSYGASRLALSVCQVVCVAEAGPPPDNWEPEKNNE
jgi:hypothetical protein